MWWRINPAFALFSKRFPSVLRLCLMVQMNTYTQPVWGVWQGKDSFLLHLQKCSAEKHLAQCALPSFPASVPGGKDPWVAPNWKGSHAPLSSPHKVKRGGRGGSGKRRGDTVRRGGGGGGLCMQVFIHGYLRGGGGWHPGRPQMNWGMVCHFWSPN